MGKHKTMFETHSNFKTKNWKTVDLSGFLKKCKICRVNGHNGLACLKKNDPFEYMIKSAQRSYKCSNCGYLGHNKTTCLGFRNEDTSFVTHSSSRSSALKSQLTLTETLRAIEL